MRGIQLTGYKNLEFVETDMPIPAEGEVLIKMSRASICGSDLRTYDRVHGEEMYPFGLGAPCHECLGEVVESYSESLSPGDKVIVLPRKTGGLMEYVAESSSRCIKLPGDGDLSVWMMAQPVGTVMYALQRVGSVLGKRVAVLSQGPIGLAFTQLLVAAGAAQVIVTDILDDIIPNQCADINQDGSVDIMDVVQIVSIILNSRSLDASSPNSLKNC